MNRQGRIWAAVSLLLLLSMILSTAPAFAQDDVWLPFMQGEGADAVPVFIDQDGDTYPYIVLMEADAAVAVARSAGVEASSDQVKEYQETLVASHADSLAAAGVAEENLLYNYTAVVNGFAAILTPSEAKTLEFQPGVDLVRRDEMRYLSTDSTPGSMGLTAEGIDYLDKWKLGGYTGEGVIVGVIDSGIWPEHPSFADDGSYPALPITLEDTPDNPLCEFGNTLHNPHDVPFACNNKLLGARQMLSTYRAFDGADPDEFDSARDDDGHGTHTASTAAGNANVKAEIFGFPRGRVSGIAPRARVIAYKGLGKHGGYSSDLAAAIDQAMADGVDVINYSVGGPASLLGLDGLYFLFAADAGVFAATSVGNSGPEPGTIDGPASVPWMTAVGANSGRRAFISTIKLRGPDRPPRGLWGGSITKKWIHNYDLIDAEGIEDVAGDTSGMCLNAFPPDTFDANDAVLCNQYQFGVARSQRVANVAAGGGGAVLFQNADPLHPNVTPTENHTLPTVHMLYDEGQQLKDYLVAHPDEVKISFSRGKARYDDPRMPADVMASFSARGPDPAALDIIKPDVTAPGRQILAGASPIHYGSAAQGQYFQAIMGTSMSSPHVAGLFALIKQAHPDWTAAKAKSALMTMARQDVVDNDSVTPAGPFDMGAGHVTVFGTNGIESSDADGKKRVRWSEAFQPGLVYDAGYLDYLGFYCDEVPWVPPYLGTSCDVLETAGIPVQAYNLNLPSIGVASVPGIRTVQRTVTSVAPDAGVRVYEVSVDAPGGFDVVVEPATIALDQGESATYSVTFTHVDAPNQEWRFGSLTWSDGDYDVYSPIAVRASFVQSPFEVSGSGADGAASFDVTFGYTGEYAAAPHGLEPATVTPGYVLEDEDQVFTFDLSGAAHFRVATSQEAVAEPTADLDIFVYDPQGELVAYSAVDGSDEQVDIAFPEDGELSVYIYGYATPEEGTEYDMFSWVVSATPGGNLSIDSAPDSATLGTTETIDVSWTGATTGEWHLGAVSHNAGSELVGLTLVEVNNR